LPMFFKASLKDPDRIILLQGFSRGIT